MKAAYSEDTQYTFHSKTLVSGKVNASNETSSFYPEDFHKIKSWLSRKKFKPKLFNPKAKSIARNPTLSFRKSLVKEIPKSIFIKLLHENKANMANKQTGAIF